MRTWFVALMVVLSAGVAWGQQRTGYIVGPSGRTYDVYSTQPSGPNMMQRILDDARQRDAIAAQQQAAYQAEMARREAIAIEAAARARAEVQRMEAAGAFRHVDRQGR